MGHSWLPIATKAVLPIRVLKVPDGPVAATSSAVQKASCRERKRRGDIYNTTRKPGNRTRGSERGIRQSGLGPSKPGGGPRHTNANTALGPLLTATADFSSMPGKESRPRHRDLPSSSAFEIRSVVRCSRVEYKSGPVRPAVHRWSRGEARIQTSNSEEQILHLILAQRAEKR